MKNNTLKIEETAARANLIMENIAVYDKLAREGFSDNVVNRIVLAVNSQEALLEAAKEAQSVLAAIQGQGNHRIAQHLRVAIALAEEGGKV